MNALRLYNLMSNVHYIILCRKPDTLTGSACSGGTHGWDDRVTSMHVIISSTFAKINLLKFIGIYKMKNCAAKGIKTFFPILTFHHFSYEHYKIFFFTILDNIFQAVFIGHGPHFKENYSVLPFPNVELYNLLAGDVSFRQFILNSDENNDNTLHLFN